MPGKNPVNVPEERQRLKEARNEANRALNALYAAVPHASQQAAQAMNDYLAQVAPGESEVTLPGELAVFLAECWAVTQDRNPRIGWFPFVSFVYDMLDHSVWAVVAETLTELNPYETPFDEHTVTVVLRRTN